MVPGRLLRLRLARPQPRRAEPSSRGRRRSRISRPLARVSPLREDVESVASSTMDGFASSGYGGEDPRDFLSKSNSPAHSVHPDEGLSSELKNELKNDPPPYLDLLHEIFDGADGSTSYVTGQADLQVEEDEDDDAEDDVPNDFSPVSSGSLKRASSTNTTGTSLAKKSKSLMVKIFQNLLVINTNIAKQKLSFMERQAATAAEKKRKMKESDLANVIEAGVERGSAEHLAIGTLCADSIMRELFLDCQTPEERL